MHVAWLTPPAAATPALAACLPAHACPGLHLRSSSLQGLLSLDSNGRQTLPPDTKTDVSRTYCLALAAAPPLDAARLGERSLTSRDLVRLLVSSVRSSAEVQQATAVLALGCMHPDCHALVLGETAVLAEDYLDRQMQRVSE